MCTCKCSTLYKIRTPYLDKSEEYEIIRCQKCGHAHAIGKSDKTYLQSIYADKFFASRQQNSSSFSAPIHVNAKKRAQALSQVLKGKLLDIGSGTGVFMTNAMPYFQVEGVEFSDTAANVAKDSGLSIYHGGFLEVDFGSKKYDVITLWDVLASLIDPNETLKKCYDLLVPGGVVIMTVPMIDSKVARFFKTKWPLLIPPVNLHYFTEQSLSIIAANCLFELTECVYDSKSVSSNFLAVKAARSLGNVWLERFLETYTPSVSVPLNLGDISTVKLKKKNLK